MKRLIKKADTWWDPSLPGAVSDNGYSLMLKNNQAIICNADGNPVKTVNLQNLHLKETDKDSAINILNSYLSELDVDDSLQ